MNYIQQSNFGLIYELRCLISAVSCKFDQGTEINYVFSRMIDEHALISLTTILYYSRTG